MIPNKLTYLIGDEEIDTRPMIPYAPLVCDFLNDLSNELRAVKEPDIAAFSFWCRRANIDKLKDDYEDGKIRLGLGLAFHITPSNVPINFAFSFAFGLLSGNANRVRVPSKPFPQIDIICTAIRRLFKNTKYNEIKVMTSFVRYEQNDDITAALSQNCHARIIWGGNETIRNIRKLSFPERSTEMTFADRYSFALIDAPAILSLEAEELQKLAESFYNDAYIMDQNACSSPQLLIWKGEKTEEAQEKFWSAVSFVVQKKYKLLDIQAVDKLTLLCHDAIETPQIHDFKNHGNLIYRLSLEKVDNGLDKLRGKYGYFYECAWHENLSQFINNKYQTLTYFGLDKSTLTRFVIDNRLKGIDRIVPMGQALDMSVIWDGFDVIKHLSRIIDIR